MSPKGVKMQEICVQCVVVKYALGMLPYEDWKFERQAVNY